MGRILFCIAVAGVSLLTGCGQVFVGFVSNPRVSTSNVSGIVIIIDLESANEIGGPVTITAVTFSNGGLSSTINFCGDQRSHFQLNQSARAEFNPGPVCSSLVAVVDL